MLTLAETKLHLRIDHDHEDTLIQELILAAVAASADYLNIPMVNFATTAPSPVKAATLLLVADLYENRELQSDRQLHKNPTYERLLNPYRVVEL